LGVKVELVNAVRAPLPATFVKQVISRAADEPRLTERLGPDPEREVTVRVTGDNELRRLNATFLGVDEVTDVLSFPSGDSSGYLGDLALSWPAVVRQAEAFGHSADVEAGLLMIHGLLHLLGWDHGSTSDAAEMEALTQACLARAGLPAILGRVTGSQ
jgi:probable rRNA maturation factor